MPKSSKERQAELKERREAEGKVKRPYWATVPEHEQVKLLLSDLRDENTRTNRD